MSAVAASSFAEWDARLQRAQAATGLVFGAYAAQHLFAASAVSLFGGSGDYNAFLGAARKVYQHPVVEAVVLGSLAGHVGAWLGRLYCRRKFRAAQPPATLRAADAVKQRHAASAAGQRAPPGWLRSALASRQGLHAASGYFLTAVVGAHVCATRVVHGKLPATALFAFVTFPMFKAASLFVPYYALLAFCGTAHLLLGAPKSVALVTRGRVRAPPVPFRAVWALSTSVALAMLIGMRLVPSRETALNPPPEVRHATDALAGQLSALGFR